MPNYIEEVFHDDKLSKDLDRILENNYTQIFSDLNGTTYRTTYVQALSIRNANGKYRETLNKMTKILKDAPVPNPKTHRTSPYTDFHKQATISYLHEFSGGSLQKLMNEMNKVIKRIEGIEEGQWNGVKYYYQRLTGH